MQFTLIKLLNDFALHGYLVCLCGVPLFSTNSDTKAIRKINAYELLVKQGMRQRIIMYKILTYLSYLLKYSLPNLRHSSNWGIHFYMPVSKKSAACEISHVLYCKTLRKPLGAIQNRMCGMLTSGVMFLHDNARPHSAACNLALLDNIN
jgi:hypothetical protein